MSERIDVSTHMDGFALLSNGDMLHANDYGLIGKRADCFALYGLSWDEVHDACKRYAEQVYRGAKV